MKYNTRNLNIGKAINLILSQVLPAFPIVAEQGANFPFAVYRRIGYDVKNSKDVYNYEETVNVEVTIAATTYSESIELAQRVKDHMEHVRGVYENLTINDITMSDAREDYVADTYVQQMIFIIDLDGR